jgi:hypothetical protein
MEDIFESNVRTSGDLAGVFEFDGEVSYFYLMQITNAEGQKIIGAIRVCAGQPDFAEPDVLISWGQEEANVGLIIRGQLWAAFDSKGTKYGGDYRRGGVAKIPSVIADSFGLS